MNDERYWITVQAETADLAGRSATNLADAMLEIAGVHEVDRSKAEGQQTMDLGAIVSVIATSGATLHIARGIAAWLQARKNVKLVIETKSGTESVKIAIENIDPETARRITERVVHA
jgi:hypothetical protein